MQIYGLTNSMLGQIERFKTSHHAALLLCSVKTGMIASSLWILLLPGLGLLFPPNSYQTLLDDGRFRAGLVPKSSSSSPLLFESSSKLDITDLTAASSDDTDVIDDRRDDNDVIDDRPDGFGEDTRSGGEGDVLNVHRRVGIRGGLGPNSQISSPGFSGFFSLEYLPGVVQGSFTGCRRSPFSICAVEPR